MDLTPLEHVGIALMVQLPVGMITGDYWSGVMFMSGGFLFRELAQAEYKYMVAKGITRKDLPGLAMFNPIAWDWGSVLDFVCPVAATLIIFFFTKYFHIGGLI